MIRTLIFLLFFIASGLHAADFGDIPANLTMSAGKSVRRNAGNTDFEAFTPSTSSGTVSSFSSGNLSPLFTTSVTNPTTTPDLSFTLSNAGAHTFFANNTGSSGAPSFTSFVAGTDYWDTTVFTGSSSIGLVPQATGVPTCLRFLDENGSWTCASGGSSGGAPDDAHYLTSQSESGLTNEVNLGALTTGLLKITVAGSVATPSSITDNSSNWDTAFTDRLKWDGGATGLVAATGRTSLGGTTVGQNFFTLTNPSAVTWARINADNTITTRTAAQTLSDLGGISGNQTITLSGDVTGSGTTAITTTLGNIPTATTMAGYIAATAIAAPGTPAAGLGRIYVDSTSKNLAVKDDAGVVKHGVQTDTGAASNFLTAISDAGAISKAQPAFSDLSGDFALTQTPSLAADKLIGRGNGGGAGDWQAITLGTNLSMSGTTLNATSGGGTIASTTQILKGDNAGNAVAGEDATPTWTGVHTFSEARTIASGASVVLDDVNVAANTTTITGSTGITTAKGFNKVSIYKPTFTDSSSLIINDAATLYIESNPGVAGSVTVTRGYAIWVDNGTCRFDSGLRFGQALPTAGRFAQSDGSGYGDSIYSIPTSASSSGKIFISNGTDIVMSTPTWPTSASTSGSVVVADGTNFTAESPSATTVAKNLGGWKEYYVTGSDVTRTAQTLADVTGLVTDTLSISSTYEFQAELNAASTSAAGNQYAVACSVAPTRIMAIQNGATSATAAAVASINASATAMTATMTYSGDGFVEIHGFLTTAGSGSPVLSIQHLKVTSGTSTVRIGSTLRIRKK